MGIDEGAWLQLWSGLFGSFIAAVIGGLVALGVVWLTNRHQSRLAAEAREKAAIADFIAGADALLTEYAEGQRTIEGLLHAMGAASVRWQMELTDAGMASELIKWPHLLGGLAVRAYGAEQAGSSHSREYDELTKAVGKVRFIALRWPKETEETRARFLKELVNLSSAITKDTSRRLPNESGHAVVDKGTGDSAV